MMPELAAMNEDQRIEHYKKMKVALERGEDCELFPSWLRNIIKGGDTKGAAAKYEDLLNAGIPDKIGFFPSNRKMYEFN